MPAIDWHSWEEQHQEEVKYLDIITLEKAGRGLFSALLSNILSNYFFKHRLHWFKYFKTTNRADGAGWGNITCGAEEYILVPHKAMLEHSPTQNTEVEETSNGAKKHTINSGSHRTEANCVSYLTRFKIIFCWLWQQI